MKSRWLWNLINIISNLQHILTHEAMNIAGETWQRSRRSSLAAGSYIQHWKINISMYKSYSISDIFTSFVLYCDKDNQNLITNDLEIGLIPSSKYCSIIR